MGKPKLRLNPLVESRCERILLECVCSMILSFVLQLPIKTHHKRGQRPHDYRIVLALCILRILFRDSYKDYEVRTRKDPRICQIFGMDILPSRSALQRYMDGTKMDMLRQLNQIIIRGFVRPKINALLDASGIRIIGRSIWYSIRVKKHISRRECDKVHIAACNDQMFILNWFITNSKKNDCPFFCRLLKPFKSLGLVIADPAYLSRKNVQYVVDKGGSPFIWVKKKVTLRAKNSFAWKSMIRLFRTFQFLFKGVYNQRSKVEAIFSALKRRYGDKLHCRKWHLRRKEMAIRLIAYNLKLIVYISYARQNNLQCWVRA